MTVEKVEVGQLDRDDYACTECDGTGKQTKRGDGSEVWRFPVPCVPCNGSGVNAATVKERAQWLLASDRFATGDGYRKVIAALMKLAYNDVIEVSYRETKIT